MSMVYQPKANGTINNSVAVWQTAVELKKSEEEAVEKAGVSASMACFLWWRWRDSSLRYRRY